MSTLGDIEQIWNEFMDVKEKQPDEETTLPIPNVQPLKRQNAIKNKRGKYFHVIWVKFVW